MSSENDSASPGPAGATETENHVSADVQINDKVASLEARIDKLSHKVEKKDKKGKKQSAPPTASSSLKAGKKGKKDKKREKATKGGKKSRKAAEAVAAKAAAKAEKKAVKAAEAKKKQKKAARAAEKAAKVAEKAAAEAGQLTKADAKGKSSGAKPKAKSKPAEKSKTTETMKLQTLKKGAKSVPNTTSLTWTSDSSIDILAGQNFCFPIEIADARPSILEWTFQTAGGDISFSVNFTRKSKKTGKKKNFLLFPEQRIDSFDDEHVRTDAFSGAINHQKALSNALTTFYSHCSIEKEPSATARAAKIFKDRQPEMLTFLQKKYIVEPELSEEDRSCRKQALHQLKKELKRLRTTAPHLLYLEQGNCFKIIGSVDITGPGTVQLVWDNSFSWMRSKQLIFSVKLKARPNAKSSKK